MRGIVVALIVAFALSAHAQRARRVAKRETEELCPKAGGLEGLCEAVKRKQPSDDPTLGAYKYEQLLYEAACVTKAELANVEDDAPIQTKMNALWEKSAKKVHCAGMGDAGQQNILKLAVFSGFDRFMLDVTDLWDVDLNYQDPEDGYTTVLDYIEGALAKPADTQAARTNLGLYQKLIVANGGKMSVELPRRKPPARAR